MTVNSNALLSDLKNRIEQAKTTAQEFENLSVHALNWKSSKSSWSILECLEHLNLYGDFYLDEIETKMKAGKDTRPSENFKSGLFGNYFANVLAAKDGEITNKMKSPKDKAPNNSNLDKKTIQRFLDQQDRMLSLLENAKSINLMKVKTSISISTLIKTRLGDTFRFLINHIDRHLIQAKNVQKNFANTQSATNQT